MKPIRLEWSWGKFFGACCIIISGLLAKFTEAGILAGLSFVLGIFLIVRARS